MGFYKNTSGVLAPIAGGVSNSYAPIGAIYPYGGTSAPSGYLLCDGSAVSRTDYSALFAVIGTSFGAGDGSTTFNVPDLREAVPVGTGENGTQTIAEHDVYMLGEFKDDQLKDHYHGIKTNGVSDNYTINPSNPTANTSGVKGWGNPWGTQFNPATTTHGKQLGVNYIIKAKDVNLSGGGQALADRVETLENEYNNVLEKVALFDLKPTTAYFPLNESTTFDNLLDTFKTFHSLYSYNNRIFEIGVYSEAEDSSTTYALARNGHPTYVGKANELYDMYPGNDIKYTAEFELQSTLAVIKISAYNATTNKFSYTYVNYRPIEPNQLRIEVSDNNSVSVEANITSQAELSNILTQAVPVWNASGFLWGAFEITGPII